jgi:hypothetical protein
MISPRVTEGAFPIYRRQFDCPLPLLEPLPWYAEFKVYKCVAKFDAGSENRRRFAFSCRRHSSVARPPSEILEGRDVLKECKR